MKPKKITYFILGGLLSACSAPTEIDEDDENVTGNDSTEEIIDTDPLYDLTFNHVEKHKIPDGCDYDGKVIDVKSWEDANGMNYFIRSLGPMEIVQAEDELSDDRSTRYIYAYHYCEAGNKVDLIREINDFEKDCRFDLNISHIPTALTLTDLDHDDIGEVTFVYRKTCTSDVSSSTQKLILLENGDKYVLRGTTEVMGDGGDYEASEEFDNAPEGFLDHAKKIWEENRTEYDFEL